MSNEKKESIIYDLSNANYSKGKSNVFKEISEKHNIGYYAVRHIYRNNELVLNTVNTNDSIGFTTTIVNDSPLTNGFYFRYPLVDEVKETNSVKEIKKDVYNEVNTLDDLIKELNIDLNKWDVDNWSFRKRQVIVNKNETKPVWSISIKLNKKRNNNTNYIEEVRELLNEYKSKQIGEVNNELLIDKYKKYFSLENDKLLVINIFDLHLSKFAWAKESGDDYDLDIAKNRFLNAIEYFCSLKDVSKVEKIILCNGGDFLHIDGHNSTTTSGTYVESDNRYQKIFKEGLDCLMKSINSLKKIAPVVFINIQGNHDKQTSYYLGVALEAYYENDNNVEIMNSPTLRKYYTYGNTSLMFTHGDKATDRLPLVFAVEHKDFSSSKFKEIHAGHLHKSVKKVFSSEDEFNGVLLRNYNSVCSSDSWHSENGFIGSVKKATALLYDKDKGRVAEYYYTI
jgi:hypothetical protein